MSRLLTALLVTVSLTPAVNAMAPKQRPPTETPDARPLSQASDRKQRISDAWKEFQKTSGGDWRVHWTGKTGLPKMIYGGRAGPYPGTPAQAARAFLTGHKTLFAVEDDTVALKLRGVRPIRAGRERVEFQLQYRNLDVYHSTIIVVIDEHGQVISVTSSAWPVRELDITPGLSVEKMQELLVGKIVTARPVKITQGPTLVVYPEAKGRLAYLAYLTVGPGNTPFEYVLDAHTGAVIRSTKLIKDDKAQNTSSSAGGEDNARQGAAAPGGGAKRVDHGPVAPRRPRLPRGAAIDPCDREWQLNGPGGETDVTEKGVPTDPFEVDIQVGISAFGIDEYGNQAEAIYGAGMKLLPCKEYTVLFDYDLNTWDSYDSIPVESYGGFWDVFAVTVNSDDFYWNNASTAPIGDLPCASAYLQNAVYPPGNTWMFGGDIWEDGILCFAGGLVSFTYEETDSAKNPYLSVLLDTGLTGNVDGLFPSWGAFNVELLSETHVFDPNPYRGGGAAPTDMDDADQGVECGAYFDVTLADFVGQPGGDNFWYLKGAYVDIQESIEDPKPPTIPEPKWRNDTFPFTRSCPEFEGVMCYYHLTGSMKYTEGLGYALGNRPIRVDPHGLNGADNSHYSPNPGFGSGYIAFGEGGVDDAEDADIILHEYGHALQDDQAPGVYFGTGGFGFGDETGAMGEGFGDYWACSTFVGVVTDPPAMGEWDAEDATGLRRVDGAKHYPEGMNNEVHDDGEIWSATLWELYNAHGKAVADTVILTSHTSVPNDPTFGDGAVALLAADSAEYASLHEESIITIYLNRGIFRSLDVTSNDANVPITVTESDVRGDANGTSDFQRVYPFCRDRPGTPCAGVNLEAPATSPSGANFVRWVVDGAAQPAGQRTVRVTVDHTAADHLARALYDVDTEACCFPNGTCTDVAPGDCVAAGGVPQGAGTFCLGDFDGNGIDDACEPPEACCFIDGSCADLGTGDCAFFGGVSQGVGTACLGDFDGNGIDDACEIVEACCFPDGSCGDLGTGDCIFFGGTPQGPGTACLGDLDLNGTDDACEAPEACCFLDGSCLNLAPALCVFVGGAPQGAGTVCLGDFDGNGIDDACEPPEACCFGDGSCANLGSGQCLTAGGIPQGAGTACMGDSDLNGVDDACEVPEACCFGSGACANVAPPLCATLGGTPQGSGSSCLGDFDGNGIDDVCEAPEACCFGDGSCANLGSGVCLASGGTAQGPGTACLGDLDFNGVDDACETPEACCFANGSCTDLAPPLCSAAGGNSQGPGSFCRGDVDGNGVDDACEPLEACCLASGLCVDAGTGDCAFFGGAPQGPGSFCFGDGDGNGVDDACEAQETCCYPVPGGGCGPVPVGTCVPTGGVVVAACLGDTNGNLIDDACEPQEACCFPVPGGGCGPVPVGTCVPTGGVVVAACLGDGDGNGIDDACDGQLDVKFSQPPTGDGEDIASNIDLVDMDPTIVAADDFASDGRPINAVRWWGSDLEEPPEEIDGWFVSFHEPLAASGALGGVAAAPEPRDGLSPRAVPGPRAMWLRSQSGVSGTPSDETYRQDMGTATGVDPADYQWDDGSAEDCVGVNAGGDPPGNTFGWANRFTNTNAFAITLTDIEIAFGCQGGGTGVNIGDAVDGVVWVDATASGNMLNATKLIQWSIPGGVHANDGMTFATHVIPGGGVTIPAGADFYVGMGDIQTELDALVRFPASIDQTSFVGRSWAFFHPTLNIFDPDNLAGQTIDLIDNFGIPGNWLIRANSVPVQTAPLALYFCDVDLVSITPTSLPACDGHPVRKYEVNLADCCLVHANPDSRSGWLPATKDAFLEEKCFDYAIDIQAVVGQKWFQDPVTLECIESPTGRSADGDFWGWHTTSFACGGSPFGVHDAATGSIKMGVGDQWLYGSWSSVTPTCSFPNLAFELLTSVPLEDGDINGNCVPDQCECFSSSTPEAELLKGAVSAKNRFLSVMAGDPGRSQAIRVTFATLPTPFDVWDGMKFFVGEPFQVCENSGQDELDFPACGPAGRLIRNWFWAAPLLCEKNAAYLMDWHGECVGGTCVGGLRAGEACSVDDDCVDVVHIFHEGIVPSKMALPVGPIIAPAVYEIQVIDSTCEDRNEDSNYSAPLPMTQAGWGDVCSSGAGGSTCTQPPDQIVDMVNDVFGVLGKFENTNALQKARTDLEPGDDGIHNGPDLKVNVASDVLYALDAFGGALYPFLPGNPCDAD